MVFQLVAKELRTFQHVCCAMIQFSHSKSNRFDPYNFIEILFRKVKE